MATTDTTASDPRTELYATAIGLHRGQTPYDAEVARLTRLGVRLDVIDPLIEYVAALNIADRTGVNAENRRRDAEGGRRLPWTRLAEFTVDTQARPGGRWLRVVSTVPGGGPVSVHAFVEKATGHVYKPDGWKRPAPGVRFRLADPDARERLLNIAASPSSIHGGYLYNH